MVGALLSVWEQALRGRPTPLSDILSRAVIPLGHRCFTPFCSALSFCFRFNFSRAMFWVCARIGRAGASFFFSPLVPPSSALDYTRLGYQPFPPVWSL